MVQRLFLFFFALFGVEVVSSVEGVVVNLRPASAATLLCADQATDMLKTSQSSRQVQIDEHYAREQKLLDIEMKSIE